MSLPLLGPQSDGIANKKRSWFLKKAYWKLAWLAPQPAPLSSECVQDLQDVPYCSPKRHPKPNLPAPWRLSLTPPGDLRALSRWSLCSPPPWPTQGSCRSWRRTWSLPWEARGPTGSLVREKILEGSPPWGNSKRGWWRRSCTEYGYALTKSHRRRNTSSNNHSLQGT